MFTAFVDASLRKGKSGIGYVIYKDDIPIYTSRKQISCPKSNTLEYLAVLELLKYINEINIKNVIIYTDNKNLTDQLGYIGSGKKIKDEVIRNIIYELSINSTIKIKWVNRELNSIAHILSREAMQGLENKEVYEPIEEIRKQKQAHETKMTVMFRPKLLMKCPSCREHKAATEFPRFRDGKKDRKCNSCELRIAMINYSYLKNKNTY
jgi:ribonuclease HI